MSNLSPNKIIGGLNRKESKSITWIYDTYYSAVSNLVLKLLGEYCPDAEDFVNETFLQLLQSTARFDRMSKIRSFLFSTAKNLCLEYLKRKEITRNKLREWVLLEQTETDNREELESHERFMEYLSTALKQLPRKQSQVFWLAYIDGLSNDQIADMLKANKKTIANTKIIAMKNLKPILRKFLFVILLNTFL